MQMKAKRICAIILIFLGVLVSSNLVRAEETEWQGENPSSNENITQMDEDGKVTQAQTENGKILEDTAESRANSGQIVNFNIGNVGITNFVNAETGEAGYTNGAYGADAAYLGMSGREK